MHGFTACSTAQQYNDQQDTYSKEVIEDQFVHLITKDYMDVFCKYRVWRHFLFFLLLLLAIMFSHSIQHESLI